MQELVYKPIGIIHSPYKDVEGMPIQPCGALGVKGSITVFKEFRRGLKDIDGFSHIILIYHFHLAKGASLIARPFLDAQERGIFAIRAPTRPNPIGISVVRLSTVEGCNLNIEDVDVVDGTPLLDIKPYVPDFDCRTVDGVGWMASKLSEAGQKKSDGRFRF